MPQAETPWDKGYKWKTGWETINGRKAQRVSMKNVGAKAWADWSDVLTPMLKLNDGFVLIEKDDPYKGNFLSKSRRLDFPVRKVKDPVYNNCHKGSANKYLESPDRYVIYTGFSSEKIGSEIPMWREHSVVVDKQKKVILESTPLKRDYYWMAPLSKAQAKKFCRLEGFQVRSSMPKLKRYRQEARVVRHQPEIIDYFLKNQNARDHEVHKWARDLGMSPEALEGEIYHLLSSLLKGVGKHNYVPDEAFDPKELEMGIKVETEHTDNEDVAKLIAKDHLMEIPDYYSRLTVMEEEGKGVADDDGAGAEFANLILSVQQRLGETK